MGAAFDESVVDGLSADKPVVDESVVYGVVVDESLVHHSPAHSMTRNKLEKGINLRQQKPLMTAIAMSPRLASQSFPEGSLRRCLNH